MTRSDGFTLAPGTIEPVVATTPLGTRRDLADEVGRAWRGSQLRVVLRRWHRAFEEHIGQTEERYLRCACLSCGVLVQRCGEVVLDHFNTAVELSHWRCPRCGSWEKVARLGRRIEWVGRADDVDWEVAVGPETLVANPRTVGELPATSQWALDPELGDADVNEFLEWKAGLAPRGRELVLVTRDAAAGDNAIRLLASHGFEVSMVDRLPGVRRLTVAKATRAPSVLVVETSQCWTDFPALGHPSGVAVAQNGKIWVSTLRPPALFHLEDAKRRHQDRLVGATGRGSVTAADQIRRARPMCYVATTGDRRVWRVEDNARPVVVAGTGERLDARRVLVGLGAVATLAVLAGAWGIVGALIGLVNVGLVTLAGLWRYGRDGSPATGVRLAGPSAVVADLQGQVYVAERWTGRIRVLRTDGTIATVAGRRPRRHDEEGGPALTARLVRPSGLALARDGSLLVADAGARRVRRIDGEGDIRTIAGGGEPGEGDGALATSVRLGRPAGLAVGSDGTIYIADRGNHRVRAVGSDGRIRTVAGTGRSGKADGPARTAQLKSPSDVAVAPEGVVLIADTGNRRLRSVRVRKADDSRRSADTRARRDSNGGSDETSRSAVT
ncbi:MAG: hypothetical protein M0Z88_09635 [Actinomycetota bacterium]|nr:hypothetical protein [Actinomycetota bacterium]